MTAYFKKDYEAWRIQIVKELRDSQSFEDFLNLDFLGHNLKRYYTLEEHKTLGDFPKKLSYAAQKSKSSLFTNYLWLTESTEAVKHLSDGSYNGLMFDHNKALNNLDKTIELGYLKSMVSQGKMDVDQLERFTAKGEQAITLLNDGFDNPSKPFSQQGIFAPYEFAKQGAYMDSELAIALYSGVHSLKNNASQINFVLGFGPDEWFNLNVKLRVLPYLWKSVLADNNLPQNDCAFTLKSIQESFPKQDEYNHLLRQCMVAFAALSHGADGVAFSPYENSYLGEHATGRVVSIIANECFVVSENDHYANNYLLDFGSEILADKVWDKYKQLMACTNDAHVNSLKQAWLEKDRLVWKNDSRKFIGLNAYLAADNTSINPSISKDGQKTFA